jgi:RNA polymerase sigma-70 factor (ECF subfamily)
MGDDQHLIAATLRGDQASYRLLVEQYQNFVFTVAFKILRNREEAEEAAQDAFLKAYRALAGFEQRSKFSTWLYQIAWRAAIDRQRLKKLDKQSIDDEKSYLQISDPGLSPSELLQQKNTKKLVQQALDSLKPEDASLLALYYLQEQTVKEISAITGLTESNVKVKLFRLRDSLKNTLGKQLKNEVKDLL